VAVKALSLLMVLLLGCGAASAQTTCKQFSFAGEVKAGGSFTQAIGNGLSFGVGPEETDGIHGWHFGIGPTAGTPDDVSDYVFLVTPPYHFRHPTDLTTDYATPAQYAVAPGHPKRFWFVLSRADAKVASDALNHDIWPKNDEDVANQGKVRERLPKGGGEFLIVDSRFTPGEVDKHGNCEQKNCGAMQWMRFRVTLVVPQTFEVGSSLQATSASCRPARWE
jgi:hypothetical protein